MSDYLVRLANRCAGRGPIAHPRDLGLWAQLQTYSVSSTAQQPQNESPAVPARRAPFGYEGR